MEPETIGHVARWEQRLLPVRLLIVALAAVGLGYYYPGLEGNPVAVGVWILLGVMAYGVYGVVFVLMVLPRLRRQQGAYVLALVDAAAMAVVLAATGGAVATPFWALMPLAVAYYAGVYGYRPGLAAATVLSVGFVVAAVLHLDGGQAGSAIATQVPLLFLLALVGGHLFRRWGGKAVGLAPGAPSTTVSPQGPAGVAQPTVDPGAPPVVRTDGAAAAPATGSPLGQPAGPAAVVAGDLYIDSSHGQVLIGGRPVALSPTETQLLQLLAEHPGVPLGHDAIRQRVWGAQSQGQGNVVDVTIHRLRRKLERQGFPGYILTVRGRGYMLGRIPS